ncbi:uncharacterized protein E0L32_000738 [Thyridium curvatum]|uniref:non-specific serine/threonine protein kinase n=1 Tax=Thyridium curvatum TaxID=1093900 RepID=A0A507B6A5_9PEZI|nr:uncharacterized protein E0L32_000738 [Thyridium curvatum]TPX12561.1 hypothetical protein E0L32_000738 [Thyridium curvatum]
MAAAVTRRRRAESFDIHEDVPSTEETEMQTDAVRQSEAYTDEQQPEDDEQQQQQQHQRQQHEEQEPEEDDDASESSDDDSIDQNVQYDMEKLQDTFPGFLHKYRLIKRIGEGRSQLIVLSHSNTPADISDQGTFSTVYKAQDLQYERFDNSWDLEKDNDKWTPPPIKRFTEPTRSPSLDSRHSGGRQTSQQPQQRRKPKYVAIKKIYVTSSPHRILNELELLHDLRNCDSVCPLITAFRHTDQVVAILPYFRHRDFRDYFRKMTVPDMAIYLRSLFTALSAVHAQGILHRDIKPTNFLYDPDAKRGVLVDFGLAEREGSESKPCLCHEDAQTRKAKLRAAYVPSAPHNGYPKNDTRPSRRANRAGTRGFRAPEVLFKCTEQTTKIDIWSVGVILLTILSRRFPFFNSADDVEAMIEIATIFGSRRMRAAGHLHGCMFDTTIPTIGSQGFTLERIILWSTCRIDSGQPLNDEEKLAVHFLERCLELDPSRRISAEEALEHEFLRDKSLSAELEDDDEMDMVAV